MAMTSCTGSAGHPCGNITQLDSLLEQNETLNTAKLRRIAELQQKRAHSSSLQEKYLANTMLYDEYVTYQADSAMKYIDSSLAIAKAVGNRDWEIKSTIDKAELLTATGLLSQSVDIMQSIDRTTLPENLLVKYYGQMIFLYSHIGNYTGGDTNAYYVQERAYKDSIMQVITPGHPEYLWYKGWDVLGTDQPYDDVIHALTLKLQGSGLNTRQDAKDAYILAKLYEDAGETDSMKKYMAQSAIVDVRTVNAEIASLEDLAKVLYSEGDVDHAYSYINYSLNKAINYPNRVKAYSISQTLDKIYGTYQAKSIRQQERTRRALLLVGVLAVALIVLTAVIISQNTKLKQQRQVLDRTNKDLSTNNAELSQAQRQLNDANRQLKELNADLKQKNEELNEANYVKEEYIGYVFTICSSYISKLEELKKNIHIKTVTKKFKEIEAETANHDMKDELKDFYRSFDSIFLHIYPNFVSDFNTLLQADKQIVPKEGELLNTELRIYALVRLGITDSVKIAEFLHCSAQTVYNNRFKVRNKAIISKKEFADTVRTLGRFQDRTS